jgi:hypothetical protein
MSIKNHNYQKLQTNELYILVLALSLSVLANAQQTPAQNNQKSILILNAKAHIGNGNENSALFKDGMTQMLQYLE